MTDDSAFFERNAIRKRQLAYARENWVRQIGDRVQLYQRYGDLEPWLSGKIINLKQGTPPGTVGLSYTVELTTIEFEGGIILTDGEVDGVYLPIVPHEDYFKGGDDDPL